MIFTLLLIKFKSLLLSLVNVVRRALCCLRPRRSSFNDSVPLTHVVSNLDAQNEGPVWSDWGEEHNDKPKTIQDYIEQYRERKVKAKLVEEEKQAEDDQNFFEDMTPRITKQMKVLVKTRQDGVNVNCNNRLNAVDESAVNIMTSSELGEWDENSGWEGKQLLDYETQKMLREQKRLDRERKLWEHQQKRLEKTSRTLGSKVTT
ncbi:hypothetical protein ABEB36_004995 [Hypothenemus hampei]|uniref:Receptor-binding cancer antigen n=1 Tax=Hypothenemus hampei TaxID=57062 RepID=A0ABD1EX11_HYPHA